MPTKTTQMPKLTLERVFDATPERLWTFWTDPKKYAKWLNPHKADLKIQEFDVRVGGRVKFLMPLDDGTEMPNEGIFHELSPYTRIVTGDPDKSFLITVTFEPLPGSKTRQVVEVLGVPSEHHAAATQGWGAGFAKLERLLAAEAPAQGPVQGRVEGRSVHLERTFRAPVAKVWKHWTTDQLLAMWFWPTGEGKALECNVKAGGRLVMAHATEPWKATWEFTEVVPEKRLVFRDLWDDGSGHAATGTVEFHAVPEGTRMVVTHGPFPEKGPYRPEDALQGFTLVSGRLAHLVEDAGPSAKGFTLERTFKAAPAKVWRMWTTPEGIGKWWVPSAKEMGFTMHVLEMDLRVGGRYAFSMKGNGHDLVNRGTYTEVVPERRLGMLWRFDIYLAPSEKPYDVPITVTLEPTAAGGTRMTFTQGPLATPGHTEGSRRGVEANFQHLAKALGE